MPQTEKEHLLLQWNASAGTASRYILALARAGYMWSQNVCRLEMSFLPRRLWLDGRGGGGGGCWKRGTGAARLGSCSGRDLPWKDMLLWLALAGPAGDLKNAQALLLHRLGCYVAVLCCRLCLFFEKEGLLRYGKKWPDIHRFPPGRLAGRERHRRSTYCCPLAQLVRNQRPSWYETGGPLVDRRPSRCHADRPHGLLPSAGLMAHQTPLPGVVTP